MAVARQRSEWMQTSHLLAQIANYSLGRKGPAIQPHQLNPFAKAAKKAIRLTRAESKSRIEHLFGIQRKDG